MLLELEQSFNNWPFSKLSTQQCKLHAEMENVGVNEKKIAWLLQNMHSIKDRVWRT